jgi:hypothetical protein
MNKHSASKAGSKQETMDMFDSNHTAIANMCLAAAGLVIGSVSAAKVKIGNTVTYLSGGLFKSKASAEVAFTATTHDIPANALTAQEAVYLLTLAADGTPTLTMGAIATGAGNALLPERPATGTPIGYVRIKVGAGATKFTAGTDVLTASHIAAGGGGSVTYVDLGFLAPRFDAAQ